MKRINTTETVLPPTNVEALGKAWDNVSASFERFCLTAGIEALGAMMEKEAEELCGPRHARSEGRQGHRWAAARARSVSMAAWLVLNGRGFVGLAARRLRCRAGSRRWRRTGSARGR